jgi:hypothetical protein
MIGIAELTVLLSLIYLVICLMAFVDVMRSRFKCMRSFTG